MTKRFLLLAMMALGGCDFGFCEAGPGQTEASLYLSDTRTGQPVANPTFTTDGETLTPSCSQPDANDPSLCTSEVLVLEAGQHRVTVSAPGYRAATVLIDTSAEVSVHLAVELQPSECADDACVRRSAAL